MKTMKKVVLFLALIIIAISILAACAGIQGIAGVGVSSVTVNSNGHLIIKLSNNETIDAGNVVGPQGPAGSDATGGASNFASLVPQVEPSIVRVNVSLAKGTASGSGTIVDKRGYILTNNHVVANGTSFQVILKDGSTFSASVIAADANIDLAIIKLSTTRTDFPVITLGSMSDIAVGMPVMAGGFPGGIGLPGPATFTEGVVSAMRQYSGQTYIQTDTPINPGNSGGCLFSLTGKMVGVPSAGITPTNADFEDINLCIPINVVTDYISKNVK
jgi:serine protease Do